MRWPKCLLTFCCCLGLSLPGWSQVLSLHLPVPRIVFQRDRFNQALVPVSGTCPAGIDRVEARLLARVAGQGTSTGWLLIQERPPGGVFAGTLPARGGWYNLEVRAMSGGQPVFQATVERVGVGEVFIAAGQSNALGVSSDAGAVDDRVSRINYRDQDYEGAESRFPFAFERATPGGFLGPYGFLHVWPLLADKLVQRLNVPVLILGGAMGGTDSHMWARTAGGNGNFTSPPFPSELFGRLFPYRALGSTLLHYASRTGVRAILWHQGESDNNKTSTQQYTDNLKRVIQRSRAQLGHGALAWVVSRASYIEGRTDARIITAQNRVIQEVAGLYPGPETDAYQGSYYRPDGLHFNGSGLGPLADWWDQALTPAFFASSIPYVPARVPWLTTGYVVPNEVAGGAVVEVPYLATLPAQAGTSFRAQLLNATGAVVHESAPGTGNPLRVTLPDWPQGTYRLQLRASQPNLDGLPGEPLTIQGTGQEPGRPAPAYGRPVGAVEMVGCRVSGWAADADGPNETLQLEFYLDGQRAGTARADLPRIDIGSWLGGEGRHGFVWQVPQAWRQAGSRTLSVRPVGSTYVLPARTAQLVCPPIEGAMAER